MSAKDLTDIPFPSSVASFTIWHSTQLKRLAGIERMPHLESPAREASERRDNAASKVMGKNLTVLSGRYSFRVRCPLTARRKRWEE